MNIKVSVIGSAGRKGDMAKISPAAYEKMVNDVICDIKNISNENKGASIQLVSGSAALSDHVAVDVWLKYKSGELENINISGLLLYMPCGWDFAKKQFMDNGKYNWKTNPGGTSNYYHRIFSKQLNKQSLSEIQQAAELGATLDDTQFGFFNRNDKVAECDYLIAFGIKGTDSPTSGGTLRTWNQSTGFKIYHNINVQV